MSGNKHLKIKSKIQFFKKFLLASQQNKEGCVDNCPSKINYINTKIKTINKIYNLGTPQSGCANPPPGNKDHLIYNNS